jgi:thiol-disulfide isomerase/thioredoxin
MRFWVVMLCLIGGIVQAHGQSTTIDYSCLDGSTFTDSNLLGKVTVVEFWMPWCNPCRKANKQLNQFYRELDSTKRASLHVVCIALESDSANWLKAIDFDDLAGYQNILDTLGKKSPTFEHFGGTSLPYSLVFNPEGKLVHQGLKGRILMEYVEKLLE